MKEVEITEVEKAKQVLELANKEKVKIAGEELNTLLDEWRKKHGCDIIISGQFQDNQIHTGLNVIISNK